MKTYLVSAIAVLTLTACGEDLSRIEATPLINCQVAAQSALYSGLRFKNDEVVYEFTKSSDKSPSAYKLIHKTELIGAKYREQFRKQDAAEFTAYVEKNGALPKRPSHDETRKKIEERNKIVTDYVLSICTEYQRKK